MISLLSLLAPSAQAPPSPGVAANPEAPPGAPEAGFGELVAGAVLTGTHAPRSAVGQVFEGGAEAFDTPVPVPLPPAGAVVAEDVPKAVPRAPTAEVTGLDRAAEALTDETPLPVVPIFAVVTLSWPSAAGIGMTETALGVGPRPATFFGLPAAPPTAAYVALAGPQAVEPGLPVPAEARATGSGSAASSPHVTTPSPGASEAMAEAPAAATAAQPATPAVPAAPAVPGEPGAAAQPATPAVPAAPAVPGEPGAAAQPATPAVPAAPAVPGEPGAAAQPATPAEPATPAPGRTDSATQPDRALGQAVAVEASPTAAAALDRSPAGGAGGNAGQRRDGSLPAPTAPEAVPDAAAADAAREQASAAAVRAPAGTAVVTATASTEAAERPASAELLARLADTVQAATTRGPRELRVLVRPPELGHIDIRVVETSEGLRVAIMASRHEVGELLQQQLPALRFALEGRDLQIDRVDVQQEEPGEPGWTEQQREPHGGRERESEGQPAIADRAPAIAGDGALSTVRPAGGRIDVRV